MRYGSHLPRTKVHLKYINFILGVIDVPSTSYRNFDDWVVWL